MIKLIINKNMIYFLLFVKSLKKLLGEIIICLNISQNTLISFQTRVRVCFRIFLYFCMTYLFSNGNLSFFHGLLGSDLRSCNTSCSHPTNSSGSAPGKAESISFLIWAPSDSNTICPNSSCRSNCGRLLPKLIPPDRASSVDHFLHRHRDWARIQGQRDRVRDTFRFPEYSTCFSCSGDLFQRHSTGQESAGCSAPCRVGPGPRQRADSRYHGPARVPQSEVRWSIPPHHGCQRGTVPEGQVLEG